MKFATTLLLVCSLLFTLSCTRPPKRQVIIGALYNLTGDQASLDVPSSRGIQLAYMELLRDPDIDMPPVDIMLLDGQTDPDVIRQLADNFVQLQVCAIVGFSDTDMVLAAMPAAHEAGIPFITSGATSPLLPQQTDGDVFLACFGDNVQAAAAAEYAYNELDLRNMFVLLDSGMEYTRLLAGYFKSSFEELGGNVIFEDTFEGPEGTIQPQIDLISSIGTSPDGFFLAAGPDDCGRLVAQLREAGFSQPVIGGDSFDTPKLQLEAGAAANDVYFTTHAFLQESSADSLQLEFINNYRLHFGTPPENAFSALAYDAVKMIIAACKARQGNETLAQSLENMGGYQGVTGEITYGPGQHIPVKNVSIVTVQSDSLKLAARITPQHVPQP